MTSISEALDKVKTRIADAATYAQRNPNKIQLLAVSKKKPISAIREAYAAGQKAFGENYLQDALPKISALQDFDIEWHYIGQIQSNKIKEIAENFNWVHGISSLKHAQLFNKHRPAELEKLACCIQVNLSNESSKGGVSAKELLELAKAFEALPQLTLRGLMTIPNPHSPDVEQQTAFASLKTLLQQIKTPKSQINTLSMGMSKDLELAISEGSTLVRVGTDIFGMRDYPE